MKLDFVALIIGIFGLIAFYRAASLSHRVDVLEEQLARMEGTPAYEDRRALQRAVQSCIGKQVILEQKSDCEDSDIISCGNTKHGSNTILDADEEWILIRIQGPKWTRDKMIRLSTVERISVIQEQRQPAEDTPPQNSRQADESTTGFFGKHGPKEYG